MKVADRKSKIFKVLKPHILDKKLRNKINKELDVLGDYHQSIPMDQIFDILKVNGIIPLQEDNTEWSGFLCGREGNTTFALGYEYTSYDINGLPTYFLIENSILSLSWHKMNTCWESIFYIG